jgi:hypothetical protein
MLNLAQTIRTDGATEWKHVLQPSPHSKNKFNPGRSQFSLAAIKESIYIYILAKGASIHIEINRQQIKIIASHISYLYVFSIAW